MVGYGKGPATAYSDFYKNNSDTPNTNDNTDLSNPSDSTNLVDTPAAIKKRRQAAIQRRLRMKKAST